ncbi:MAG: right-handed parallel beta-helix repeat-containing protein [Candidatus Aenigmarchaeota archaeon]|nr:right-handed parallel beta-helix repeat-containing protein [Candidatus Aenigmarchaeota archaeon]
MGARSMILCILLISALIPAPAAAQGCLTGADEKGNCDGIVDISELRGHINEWYVCSACIPDLFNAIQAYYGIPLCDPEGIEVCNGFDDNCNGQTDEGFDDDDCPDKCGFNWTGNGGNLSCCGDDAGEASPFEPVEVTVDGNDNDCDGEVDEVEILENAIYVDNQLTADCVGTYSIASRDCSGSDGDAYDTPQEAADVTAPGDTVYFRNGTYYERTTTQSKKPVLHILTSGTEANPITYKNYNNEEAIIQAWDPYSGSAGIRKYHAVRLGVSPSSNENVDVSGQGVKNIIIDGLIVEGGSYYGMLICGEANRLADASSPTENVIIRNVIARWNSGSRGGGIHTMGTVINLTIEYCEAYENEGSGISLGRLSKTWHVSEPDNRQSAARYSTIRNCLTYKNNDPADPGDTDGMGGSNMYRCTFENNVVFNNSDDGMDVYASVEVLVQNNIVFYHNYTGGNNAGIKYSAGGGGGHTLRGNVVFNNVGWTFEGSGPSNPQRVYRPSRLYNNMAYKGSTLYLFGLGSQYDLTYPGFEKVYLRNNIALGGTSHDFYQAYASWTDSDYNFIGNADDYNGQQGRGSDNHSLTGDPGFANENVVIDTNFGAGWTIEQKLDHIRSQVSSSFNLASGSQLIDKGTIIAGYHCPTAGEYPEDCREWYGSAPDIGVYQQ